MGGVAQEAERVGTDVVGLNRIAIFIVPKPHGWTPGSPTDLPPEFERHSEHDIAAARTFVDGFNSSEMLTPAGWWAIVGGAVSV
jgi:hypothetical protein